MNLIGQLIRVLRAGVVTTGYPNKTDVPDRKHRGTPVLLQERCVGAAACARVCPTGAIQPDEASGGHRRWVIDYGLCIFCGACVLACEQEAVATSDDFELASRTRQGTIGSWEIGRADE